MLHSIQFQINKKGNNHEDQQNYTEWLTNKFNDVS